MDARSLTSESPPARIHGQHILLMLVSLASALTLFGASGCDQGEDAVIPKDRTKAPPVEATRLGVPEAASVDRRKKSP